MMAEVFAIMSKLDLWLEDQAKLHGFNGLEDGGEAGLDKSLFVADDRKTDGCTLMEILVCDFGDGNLEAVAYTFSDAANDLSFALEGADTLEVKTEAANANDHDQLSNLVSISSNS